MTNTLSNFALNPVWRHLAKRLPIGGAAGLLGRISDLGAGLTKVSDSDLRTKSLSLRYRALSGEPVSRLLPEAYSLVRESTTRVLAMRHYDVQLLGGIAMHGGAIAEMQTGEGKTLTATLPLYLAALNGKGAHLATANDYLASRDARFVRPVFDLLGLTVAAIESSTTRQERRKAYRCDVTYAAAREYGFDFLRDRLFAGREGEKPTELLGRMLGHLDNDQAAADAAQRPLHFCLVDEADSILIDEARTPLIVSALPGDTPESTMALFRWSAEVAPQFLDGDDYEYNAAKRSLSLSGNGRRKVRELPKPDALAEVGMLDLYEHVERAVLVARDYVLDRHYVVRDGEIIIVDEFTGRLAIGRKWRSGIHQAIEAKEGLEVSLHSGEAARVTVQDFFLQYPLLAGMTGTAANSRRELRRIYKLNVRVVPTNRPCQRETWPDLVFATAAAKWDAVVEEVNRLHAAGRPVVIGTRSIDKSEFLAKLLIEAGIQHQVLNARRHAEEAKIVARAGEAGQVTVATNMAGRGTDIKLGERVAELGGLHVIGTELHESSRIDRQLAGRCARQGDPGSFRQFMSLADDILRVGFGAARAERLRGSASTEGPLPPIWSRILRRAQRRVEREHFRQRRLLLYQAQNRRKVQGELGQDPYLDASC